MSIECLSEMPTVSWYKEGGKQLEDNVNYRPPIDYNEHHTLVITEVRVENYGTYVCQYKDHQINSIFINVVSKSTLHWEGRAHLLHY